MCSLFGSLSQLVNTSNPLPKQLHRPPLECGAKLKMKIYSQGKWLLYTCLAVNACRDLQHWETCFSLKVQYVVTGTGLLDMELCNVEPSDSLRHSDSIYGGDQIWKQCILWQILIIILFVFLRLMRCTGSCTFCSMWSAWHWDTMCHVISNGVISHERRLSSLLTSGMSTEDIWIIQCGALSQDIGE